MNRCELDELMKGIARLERAIYSSEQTNAQRTKRWYVGSVVTAPGAGGAIFTLYKAKILLYGIELACDEANTFLVTWVSNGVTYQKRYPTPSAGTMILVSDFSALNEGLEADTSVAVTVESAAAAGKKYQASLLVAI